MTIDEYNKIPNKCKFCNSIIPFNTRNRIRNRKFCNTQCVGKYCNLQSVEKYLKNPTFCKRCKIIIPYKKRKIVGINKYCGNKCSVNSTNKLRLTDDVKRRIGNTHKKIQRGFWTIEKRKIHSELMQSVVTKNPDSYSTKNVCGRVKSIKTVDSYGNETYCMGRWEILVSEYLTKYNIKWVNKIKEVFQYIWNGKIHRYFPDFFLPERDCYVEVKGYERDRDIAKWSQFPKNLIILKKLEIDKIKTGLSVETLDKLI